MEQYNDYHCELCKRTPGCHLALLPSRTAFLEHLRLMHADVVETLGKPDVDRCRYRW